MHGNRKQESGFQKVSGAALEPDRNMSGWLVWVSLPPGVRILLQGHLMDPQTSLLYKTETLLAGVPLGSLAWGACLVRIIAHTR